MTTTETHSVGTTEVAGGSVQYLHGGSGSRVLVLHHSIGNIGWIPFYEALAQSHEVFVPDLPGYGQSERPEWARHPRDLAILFHQLLHKAGGDEPIAVVGLGPGGRDGGPSPPRALAILSHQLLHRAGGGEPIAVVGLGLGGWIAAEMATMNQSRISSLVLVGAPGIQPDEGEILDQMLVDYHEYVRAGFHDETRYEDEFGTEVSSELKELWDFSREMTARLSWKPYMYSRELPHLLQEVQTPTLVVWGDDDRVVPISSAQTYERSMPNARLVIIEDCGHFADFEQPDALVALVTEHIGAS